MFLSLSNDLLLGIVIGIILCLLFQIAQRWATSAQRQLPCLIIAVAVVVGLIVFYFWFMGA
jgi:ABC-type amino acid transport system permease subunit